MTAHVSEEHQRTGNHPEPGRVSDGASHRDQAASQRGPHFVSGRSHDENLATRHASRCSAISGTEAVARVPFNAQATAAHFGTGPVGDVASHGDLAAGHLGPEMHARIAFDEHPAGSMFLADPLHTRAVSHPDDLLIVTRRAGHFEEFAERLLSVALLNQSRLDLTDGLFTHDLDAHGIHFDRDRR